MLNNLRNISDIEFSSVGDPVSTEIKAAKGDEDSVEGAAKFVLITTMMNHNALPENTCLGKISMLGSHNSGTYDFNGFKSLGSILHFAFKTQSKNLKE